jgi:hypothetical protein
MIKSKNLFFIIYSLFIAHATALPLHAALTGTASVNMTSDTSAVAKRMATNDARRQIITMVLDDYADKAAVAALVKNAKDAELEPLIASSGMDNEKVSATTYSADFRMTLSETAARKFLDDANIANNLGMNIYVMDKVDVVVPVTGMRDFVDMLGKINTAGLMRDFHVKSIDKDSVTLSVPSSKRAAFLKVTSNQ